MNTNQTVAFAFIVYVLLIITAFLSLDANRSAKIAVGAKFSPLSFWQVRFLSGLSLFDNFGLAFASDLELGRVVEITYRDASGILQTRTVELFSFDAKRNIYRTREISTNRFRQVIVANVVSVRWNGEYKNAVALASLCNAAVTPLTPLTPLAQLAQLAPYGLPFAF